MDRSRKLLPDFVKQFSLDRGCGWTPETPEDLAWNFLMKVQALDVTARDSILRCRALSEDIEGQLVNGVESLEIRDIQTIHPLDVLCASMLCSDSSLQRQVMSNMYQCGFALPLLLPDAENNKSILMLGAMKDIVKKQSAQSSEGPPGDTEQFLTLIKMPVISFVRLGYCSFSKSRILNTLLSPADTELHKIFIEHDLPALVLPRQISDGLVEIAWCFPDGDGPKENQRFLQKPVAIASLRGDLQSVWTQFGFLMEVSSAVFFFTDFLGEKEWDLLMFLGEAAVERCYFVLSPQARESEEAQIFQSILKLKASQVLFWEEEEARETGKNMEGLQAALQEVMSLSLKCVSVQDMASLARELGVQVDQDLENVQGIHVSSSGNLPGIAEDEEHKKQQRHGQPKSSSEGSSEMSESESGARCKVNHNLQNIHHTPEFMPPLGNSFFLQTSVGDNFNHASFKPFWVINSHFWSEQRSKRLCPSPFQNTEVYRQGGGAAIQYFQPQNLRSHRRFMKFPGTAQRHHGGGILGRPPIFFSQPVQAWLERSQKMGAFERSGTVVSQGGHFHALGSQRAGAARKPQPQQDCAQLTWATEKPKRKKSQSHSKYPLSPAFPPAGAMQRTMRPAFWPGAKLKSQTGTSNPTFQVGSLPMSHSKFESCFQFRSNQPKTSQPQFSQPKPSQSHASQPKPSQSHQSKPHFHPSQDKSQTHCTQAKPSPSKPTQPKPSQPKSSSSKPSQHRPAQPKSSKTSPSHAKAHCPGAGPKRAGKH